MDWRLAKRAFGRPGGRGVAVPHKFNLTVFGFHTFLTTGRQKIVGEAVSYRQVTFQSIGQGTKPLASRSENSGSSSLIQACNISRYRIRKVSL